MVTAKSIQFMLGQEVTTLSPKLATSIYSERALKCKPRRTILIASYPASVFHTVSDNNLRHGKVGDEATVLMHGVFPDMVHFC